MKKRSEMQFLKFFVYMLGFILAFGTLILIYIAYKKNVVDIVAQVEQKNKCSNLQLDFPGKIQNISLERGLAHIIWREENGSFKISIYDYCNGNLINEVSIKDISDNKVIEQKRNDEVEERNILS